MGRVQTSPPEWGIPAEERSQRGEVEIFLDRSSAVGGDQIGVYLSSVGAVELTVWRLGYEAGRGGRLVAELGSLRPGVQAGPAFDRDSGLVSCSHWARATSFSVAPSWPSGVYSVRADTRDAMTGRRWSAEALLVVCPTMPHDLVVIIPVTTWVAYNSWGGRSLYDGGGFTGLARATAVSFDRPMKPTGSPIWELEQGHPFFTWEYPLVRWLEREGFDVGYVSNLELDDTVLPSCRALVSAGHDEYWSAAMRNGLDRSLGRGAGLFWAGANGMCWNIRLEQSPLGSDRTLVCFKDHLADPVMATSPNDTTGRWGEWPLYRSESDVLGVRWVDWDFSLNRHPADWVAAAVDHPLFAGTGLQAGDRVAGIVGDEWDAVDPGSPVAGLGTILGHSEPLVGANLGPSVGHTYAYRHPGGGLVVASGTTSWAWGLDTTTVRGRRTQPDQRLQALTRNIVRAVVGAG